MNMTDRTCKKNNKGQFRGRAGKSQELYLHLHKNTYTKFKDMELDAAYFNKRKEKALAIYAAQKNIYNPYLKSEVIFNSDGFHHLQFSARRERSKKEQLLKFNLLPLAIKVIRNSGTLQEYRKGLTAAGKKSKDGLTPTKMTEYWGFVAIVGTQIKIRAVLRRVGNGNIIFWSVMPFSKIKGGQKLYSDGIEDEE